MNYDIILIDVHRDHFGSVSENINIGINLLTVFLRAHGYQAGMYRGFAHETMAWLEKTMRTGIVRSIGLYCDYENMTLVAHICRTLKRQWDIPVFVGGPQAVGLKETFLRESACDAVVRGDGEKPLLELLHHYLQNGKSRAGIRGLTYLDQTGTLVRTPPGSPVQDLDSLPWPDFRLEKGHHQWSMLPVITGRGCPYSCAFCYEGSNSRHVRFRSVANVLAEIAHHLEQNPRYRYIFFLDDTFTLSPGRVAAFCDGLARLREKRDLVWFCEGHVQNLYHNPQMIDQMVAAGLVKLFIGIESGSNKVLQLYGKKTSTRMIEAVVRRCVEAGVSQITGNIIIGGPRESPATLAQGSRFIKHLLEKYPGRLDAFGFFLIPYPNTAITTRPHEFGIKLLPEREAHALEDIPMGETAALNWSALLNARHRFNRDILHTMQELYAGGRVPHETILEHYRLATQYGALSRWYLNVFTSDPIRHRYYRLICDGKLQNSRTIPAGDISRHHPRRVFELWNTVSFKAGYPRIGQSVLSPLEYRLLLLCSGKLRLEAVLARTWQHFGDRFDNPKQLEKMAMEILSTFEQRNWIGYAPY